MNVLSLRAVVLGVVLLAFGMGFYKTSQRPPAAAFQAPALTATRHEAPRFLSRFASSRLHTQAHAASLIELKDGRIRAFWFSGSREGAPDVEIHTAVFDPAQGQWSMERSVTGREQTQQALQRYVAKVGNPAAGRMADGSLRLFYVTVSLGGWAGSSITAMTSTDDGETWGAPERLVTSPFLNLSTLVRGTPFLYADGTMGFPVYHEFLGKFGELLRFDNAGKLIDKQRLSTAADHGLQPVMLVQDAQEARVLMRHSGDEHRRVISASTHDAGKHWTAPAKTALSNPDAALSAVVLPDGRLLAALNNFEQGRDALSLMLSADGGVHWQFVYQLEDQQATGKTPPDEARYLRVTQGLAKDSGVADAGEHAASAKQQLCSDNRCRYEFSYPHLMQTKNGEFHLVYTWNRSFIKHVAFTQAWLDQQLKAK